MTFWDWIFFGRERERERESFLAILGSKTIIAKYWGAEKWTNNITCIDRGLEKPKEARYWRMLNDFPVEEKLPTEGGIKKTRFRSYSVSSAEQKTELCTLVWFLKAFISSTVNACADMTIVHGDNCNTLKKLKDLKAKIAYRYCKSQTIAVCEGISILTQLTTLWLNLGLIRDKWRWLGNDYK